MKSCTTPETRARWRNTWISLKHVQLKTNVENSDWIQRRPPGTSSWRFWTSYEQKCSRVAAVCFQVTSVFSAASGRSVRKSRTPPTPKPCWASTRKMTPSSTSPTRARSWPLNWTKSSLLRPHRKRWVAPHGRQEVLAWQHITARPAVLWLASNRYHELSLIIYLNSNIMNQMDVGHNGGTQFYGISVMSEGRPAFWACLLSDWSIRCSRRSSLWSLPVSTALTSVSLPTDRPALERPTPWRWFMFWCSCLVLVHRLLSTQRTSLHICVCVCVCVQGVVDDPGINQRALRLLFSEVTDKAPDWDYNITVSMVEIYNETLRWETDPESVTVQNISVRTDTQNFTFRWSEDSDTVWGKRVDVTVEKFEVVKYS